MEKDLKKRKRLEWLAAAGMSVFLLGVVWTVLGSYFEANDDRVIAEILSGAAVGHPEAHVVYVHYFLAWPMSLLYRLTDQVPWYGLTLLSFHLLVYIALFKSAFSRGKSLVENVLIAGFMGSFVLLDLYITAAVEFTSTAAIMAVAGYMCLLLDRGRKSGWVWFCFFETMAFLLRDQAMLMIQPMGLAVCMIEFRREKQGWKDKKIWKEWIKKAVGMIAAVVMIVLTGTLGTWIHYHGEGWDSYNRYLQGITTMFDYCGAPAYEEVKDILDRYHVSYADYASFCRYVSISPNLNTECVEELADYAESAYGEKMSVPEVLRGTFEMRSDERYLNVGRAAGIVCCVVFFVLLLQRHYTALISVTGLVCGSVAVEGYLVYRGRLPLRVILPLYCCETFFLAAILLRDYSNGKRTIRNKVPVWLSMALFAAVFLISGRQQYHAVKSGQEWQKDYIEGLLEVQEYCRAHPEKRYILSMQSFTYYRGCVLETRLAGPQNHVFSGGWYFRSPVMNDHLHSYLDGEEENICLIVYDDGLGEANPEVVFLAEAVGAGPVVTDSLEVSNGAVYLVWGFVDD